LYDVSGIDVAEKSTDIINTKSVEKTTENKSLETKSQKAPLPLFNR